MIVFIEKPFSLINELPPSSVKSIIDKIKISSLLTLKFSVNNSAHAIAVPPVATKSSTITIF